MHEQGHEQKAEPDREDELAVRQGARLYPIGQALRATFDAENHDTLGGDVTGLMINLSHVDPPAPKPVETVARPVSLLEKVTGLFGRRRDH